MVIFVGIIFFFGFWLGRIEQKIKMPLFLENENQEIDFSLFWQAWQKLEQKYIGREELDAEKMLYGAIRGMVESIEDPHTVFFEPEETERFLENIAGEFEGVGMEIGIRQGKLLVISPIERTPAFRAGLKPGDNIIKIDDVSTIDISIEKAVNLIRGPKGTEVVLTILRKDWEKPKKFSIIRETIQIPSLRWELKEPEIAYIKLYHFSQKASPNFRKVAFEILNSRASRIILDLRNNPGGYLDIAQSIAGWFLERGKVISIEDFGKGRKREHISVGPSKLSTYPIVILINQGSASGSEILAAAIRDNREVKLIGENSFGKGSVQKIKMLENNSSLKITIAKWRTPKGQLIEEQGLSPDIKIEMTEQDYEQDRDPQLDKAIEIIKGLR